MNLNKYIPSLVLQQIILQEQSGLKPKLPEL